MSDSNKISIVIHHYPCSDGELSAAIFKKYMEDNAVKFIPWLHELKEKNIDVIKEEIVNNKDKTITIYFLDYCPNFNLITEIKDSVNNIVILDHHKSACLEFINSLEKYDGNMDNIKIVFNNDKSGCQLTWEYFYPDTEYPIAVKHVGNRDIWKWDDPDTEPFTCAFPVCFNLSNKLSSEERLDIYYQLLHIDDKILKKIIDKGKRSIQKMKKECEKLLPLADFFMDKDINDKELSVVEIPMTKYHLTKYITELVQKELPEHDVLRLSYQKKDMVVYSLRSLKDDIRVDLLAQKYGGNGHAAASGYNVKNISKT